MTDTTANQPSVLFVAFNYPPYANVGIYRTLRFTRYIGDFGWKPLVLTSEPCASHGRLDDALIDLIPEGMPISRVPLVRREDQFKSTLRRLLPGRRPSSASAEVHPADIPSPSTTQPTARPVRQHAAGIRRRTTEVFFGVPDNKVSWKRPAVEAGLEMVRQYQPRAVMASGPPFTTHLVAREIAKRTKLPMVLDFRDPWSRAPWGARHQSRMAQRMVTKLEQRCVTDAASVVLNTKRMQEEFQSHYANIPSDRFEFISNGFDPDLLTLVNKITAERTSRPDGTPLRLLHPGSLYRNRDPRPLLDAIQRVAGEGTPIHFEQLGPWDPQFDLPNHVNKLGIEDQVRLSAPVPHRQMLQRMADCDAFVLLQPGTDMQIPGKLFEMLLFKKPILALADTGSVAELITASRMGVVAPPTDTEVISTSLRDLHDFKPCDAAWSDAIQAYDGRALSKQLGVILDGLTGFR